MELEHLTRREFIRRSIRFALGAGAAPLYLAGCKGIPRDGFLLLKVNTSVSETLEFRDPSGGRPAIQGSPDFIYRIEEGNSLILSPRLTSEDEVSDAQCVICQEIGYSGNIGITRAAIYALGKVPGSVRIRSGFPKERFDGITEPQEYLDEVLAINYIGKSGNAEISLNSERFTLSAGENRTQETQKYEAEIDPGIQEKESGTWRWAYSNVIRTSFDVTTGVENLGLFRKERTRVYNPYFTEE